MRELVVIVVVALIIVFDLTLNDARLFWSVDAHVNALMWKIPQQLGLDPEGPRSRVHRPLNSSGLSGTLDSHALVDEIDALLSC
jgi:hypothetical protein